MNGALLAVGSRTSSAARTAASPMAWICDAMPPRRGSLDELAQSLRGRVPDATPQVGRERPVGLGFDVGEQGGRPRPERAVGEALQPADARTSRRIRPRGRAPLRSPRSSAVSSDSGRSDAMTRSRQPPGLGQMGVGRERPAEVRVGDDAARIVDGDDTERRAVRSRPRPAATSRSATDMCGTCAVTSARRALEEHSLGLAVGVVADDPAGRIGRRPVDAGGRPARLGWPAARGGRVPRARTGAPGPRARGRRPSASGPSGPSPSRARRATPTVGQGAVRGARHAPSPPRWSPRRDRSTSRAATAPPARCRCASVNPGSATSSGSSAIRSVNGSARVSSATSEPANATRPSRIPIASTQPKPRSAGERRDPTGDQAVERHRVRVAGRPGARPARRGRARRRARARARPAP